MEGDQNSKAYRDRRHQERHVCLWHSLLVIAVLSLDFGPSRAYTRGPGGHAFPVLCSAPAARSRRAVATGEPSILLRWPGAGNGTFNSATDVIECSIG